MTEYYKTVANTIRLLNELISQARHNTLFIRDGYRLMRLLQVAVIGQLLLKVYLSTK